MRQMNGKIFGVLFVAIIAVIAMISIPSGDSLPGGVDTNVAAAGCSCHGVDPTAGVMVTITAPENFTAGESYNITVSVSGGPNDEITEGMNATGGFSLRVNSGTLESSSDDTQLWDDGTISHTESGNDQREWTMGWTASDDDSKTVTFTAYGNSVNGDSGNGLGNSGDYWNAASKQVPGINVIVDDGEITFAQKIIYAVLLFGVTIGAVGFGYRVVNTEKTVEEVFGKYWDYMMEWIVTTDHKKIGILYFVTGFFFLIMGGILALAMRVQLMYADNDFLTNQEYNSAFTMHGTTMVFLSAMPMIAAFANYLVPLQIGARDLAFPRLNALSYWLLPAGGITIYAGYLAGGAGDVGWTGYAPYSSGDAATAPGTDLWVSGQIMLGASSTITGINFMTTILLMRAPGVTLMRMPLFTWSIAVSVFLMLLAMPVFTVALILLFADRTFGTLYFDVAAGGDPILWQHLFWYFGHPEVYILVMPAFGIISEVVATFSKRPIYGYNAMVMAIGSIGIISFIVWGHHMFTSGSDPLFRFIVMLTTMLVAIPTGVKIFNWLATITGGKISRKTAMLFSLGAIATFTIGGITGIILASIPLDLALHDTYFVVAHFHYVIIGGILFGFYSGVYYWYPKVTGRLMNEKLGVAHFVTSMIFFNLAFYPMHNIGLMGMPRRYSTYSESLGIEELNYYVSIFAILFGLSQLFIVANMIYSYRKGEEAGDNPWNGWSLEWVTSSPPPHNSFTEIPTLEVKEDE